MSWVANLFNPTQSSTLASPDDRRRSLLVELGQDEEHDVASRPAAVRQQETQQLDEEEEAARSPLWHVSNHSSTHLVYKPRADDGSV